MLIIHIDDVVLATVDGDDPKSTIKALALDGQRVSIITLTEPEAESLGQLQWSVVNGQLVLGDTLKRPDPGDEEPVYEPPVDPLVAFNYRLVAIEAALANLQAAVASLKPRI